uniref:E3 ubiquitin-protein ligase TRIM33 n=1 Tax=Cynoglossus semilaevis TaxID=244447 RepID=A0A3P8V0V2_CYNSE
MADNKDEEDLKPSANWDSVPLTQDNERPDAKGENVLSLLEASTKVDEEMESHENTNEAPTPTNNERDANVGAAAAAAVAKAGGEANGSVSIAVSPVEANTSSTEPMEVEAVTARDAAGEAGATAEMSPPPTVPGATPVSTPINLLDTCAVCKQSLQNRDCEPKLLPCLHSFCLKCIPQPDRQVSLPVPGPHGQTETHIVNIMRCTVCHQDCKQIDIIDNYFVKDTTEATSTSDEKSAQVCTSCEDNAGTIAFCVQCGEWLCKTCVEAHQRVKITKDHKIHTKEDADAASGQRPVFCPVHKQETLKLFCETCDTLTCRDCQLLEHKEHRYQFLEEAFQNQKGIIETSIAKLREKKNYVHYCVSQVQNRLKELNETHKKVEHEIKIAVFTLINEINKKGKALLQQLEGVTKERSMRLIAQHKDTTQLAQQIHHVLNFCHWAITTGSSTALLYSKRLILFQLRQLFKARLEAAPQANGGVRFFCDPTFWAKNVANLGNLVIEKPAAPAQPPGVLVGGPPVSPGQGHPSKHPGQINLAQLRLQHMQQAVYAQKQQQQQQHQQHQQIQQQMRIPPRLISMQQMPRGPGGMNGGPGGPMYPSSHHMRLPGPPQGRMPSAQPRMNGQQYSPMMQPQIQRQHSNPGHAGPFPVASHHNANPTSPTSASMAGAHAHRGPASPIVSPIELIPSVTNPENLPCLPEIPYIQLEDVGSSNLGNLLTRYISASTQHQQGVVDMNPSPALSTHSPGSSGLSNAHTPARPSSTSSTGSRGSCSSSGKTGLGSGTGAEQVKVKQEPGTDSSYSCPSSSVKSERSKDAGRSACMMSSPESSPCTTTTAPGQEATKTLADCIKTEPHSTYSRLLTNGSSEKGAEVHRSTSTSHSAGKEEDPNEDWCAVCINGGDLLCCDRCPKVFHMKCHVPTIKIFPKGDFLCTFCRSISSPEIEYCDDNKKYKGEQCLNPEDQRKCERLLLYIYCHELSVGFREPVPSSVPNYYKIIKQPMDLKKVKKKLQLRTPHHYLSVLDFVSDMRLVFKNCAMYNEVGSEMEISGKTVSLYFEDKLLKMFPGQNFPERLEVEPRDEKEKEKEEDDADDSDDNFVQPRRKRLKADDKAMHIK